MASKDEFSRDLTAIRCARATMLLYSLASSRTIDSAGEKQEKGETRREIEDLRRKLTMVKIKMNRIKLCGLMELLLLVFLVLLLSTFFLVFFLGST
ncbi:hypothetical protein ISN45_At01g069040 [Arabidopsis thaliana x Arabidopsis arenosa]|jgi:hypothetical protein|uniref:Transmembrane protein n=4 Tax=Arabidopsis TaxID=3701 RepID=A0A178WN64_ARATH|nr:uncharacterized protein AT1G78172 [Arabidopsis thaliana]AEE36077.1 transmembrane protein [Arabidopsis thaliana]KAG7652126.1 hypothetical protein ISN45_At01g069040 [Arabidopsis thaliana x Arabidopsis arenosa]KAG7659987.1 hypothetical protein ISN44_As01g067910 [Arabidopsis suecica]OAP19678.1 hypothetical protein AXX17_AT1G72780 [Arabidopsis thaliana]|eukprot:NP_001117617.1 transmembrane protein [Arabidopsis thaliana]